MTPVPLDLPLRPPEAAELARIVFELANRKPLTDALRNRIAARAAGLRLASIRPFFGSLVRDPIHHSTYYLAIDAPDARPLLLHFAPAAAPTGSVFPNALLIGRIADIVINAIPFGAADRESLDAFALRLDSAFQPRPHGARSAIVLEPGPAAFDAFRGILNRTRKNLAATAHSYHLSLWCAIRAGWREGWSAGIELDSATARDVVRDCPFYTRFTIATADWDAAAQLHEFIRETRAAAQLHRPFDFELSLESSPAPTTPTELVDALQALESRGHPAQLIAPRIANAAEIQPLAAAARLHRCAISIRSPWLPVAGRMTYKVSSDTPGLDFIASALA